MTEVDKAMMAQVAEAAVSWAAKVLVYEGSIPIGEQCPNGIETRTTRLMIFL